MRAPTAPALRVIVANDHLYADGGADVVALGSAEALEAAGVPVTLFVADALRADDQQSRQARLVATGQADLLGNRWRARAAVQGLWNLPAARSFEQLLAQHDPADTVVHLHSWTKSLSASVLRTALGAGFAVVCTLHEYFSICPNGGLFDFQRGQICRIEPMSARCVLTHCDARRYAHKLYRVARQVVQRHAGRMPVGIQAFIVVSRFSERLLAPHLPPGARVYFVRNPIDASRQPPADVQRREGFVAVARLSVHKGQELFLRACAAAGVPATCVGDGEDRAALQQRFPAARFTGQLPPPAVARTMRSARALVLPSLFYETQGLVVDEAAALGVPAIVPDECAASDSVIDGQTGLVFRSGDQDSLVQALRRLHDDPAFAALLGRQAYERFWRQPPTPAAHAAALIDVYLRELHRIRAGAAAATGALVSP